MKGAEVNARSKSMRTPLHVACAGGRVEIVEMLLKEEEIDYLAEDQDRNSPIHLAAQGNHKNIVALLLKKPNIDLTTENAKNEKAFDLA